MVMILIYWFIVTYMTGLIIAFDVTIAVLIASVLTSQGQTYRFRHCGSTHILHFYLEEEVTLY